MEHVEHLAAGLVIEILENKHADDAGQRPEQSERGMAFQLREYRRKSFCHLCFTLKVFGQIRPLETGLYL